MKLTLQGCIVLSSILVNEPIDTDIAHEKIQDAFKEIRQFVLKALRREEVRKYITRMFIATAVPEESADL